MMLSDADITRELDNGRIVIDPTPPPHAIQPASVDLYLGHEFVVIGRRRDRRVHGDLTLQPGQCALAATLETVSVPAHLVARVEGKSSWGRKFLMVHSTAGFIDPGFSGEITLELVNLSPRPIRLRPMDPIAQVSFSQLKTPAKRPYGSAGLGSHYQHQKGPTLSCL